MFADSTTNWCSMVQLVSCFAGTGDQGDPDRKPLSALLVSQLESADTAIWNAVIRLFVSLLLSTTWINKITKASSKRAAFCCRESI